MFQPVEKVPGTLSRLGSGPDLKNSNVSCND